MIKLPTLIAALITFGLHAESRQLVWVDPNPPGVVQRFNVYQSPVMPPVSWQFIASVSATSCDVAMDQPQMFFTVTEVLADGIEVPEITSGETSTFTKLLPPKLR